MTQEDEPQYTSRLVQYLCPGLSLSLKWQVVRSEDINNLVTQSRKHEVI